jgi:N-acetylmuramoyl-L-alanine amidase
MATVLWLMIALVGPRDPAPAAVVVATSMGTEAIPVSTELGYPALAARALERVLPLSVAVDTDWVVVRFAQQPFRFLLESPVVEYQESLIPLVGGAYLRRDSLFLPLQWLADFVPRHFAKVYRYDPTLAEFEEVGRPVVATTSVDTRETGTTPAASSTQPSKFGLRYHHWVVVDAGHGGPDPGTPGSHLPRGVQEKHVTLAIATALQKELDKRGIKVEMTRTTDVLIPYKNRARQCRDDCDLFVSIHVNSSPRRSARGVETYFLDRARTAEAARVAAIENEALRYEGDFESTGGSELDFILKDLSRNEYLRESAQLADFIQQKTGAVHPGGGRYVAQADFAVLRYATRPAVLVETGYGSNAEDGAYLASVSGQRAIAAAIADGIVDYLRRYESKTTIANQ